MVPCQIFGRHAEKASEVEAGTVCVFEGKIAKRRRGEDAWEMIVSGFELLRLGVPIPTGGRHD